MDFHERGGQAVGIGGRSMCATQSQATRLYRTTRERGKKPDAAAVSTSHAS